MDFRRLRRAGAHGLVQRSSRTCLRLSVTLDGFCLGVLDGVECGDDGRCWLTDDVGVEDVESRRSNYHLQNELIL